ncbi:MAG: hypothetical protein ABSB95_08325 [Dissulfurispiraceae bacterium]|jgi:hypothetical protein
MEKYILIVKTELLEHICLGIVEANNPFRALIEGLQLSDWKGWEHAEFFCCGEDIALQFIHTKGNCWMENNYAGLPVLATYLSNHKGGYLIALKLDEFDRVFKVPPVPVTVLSEHFRCHIEYTCSS